MTKKKPINIKQNSKKQVYDLRILTKPNCYLSIKSLLPGIVEDVHIVKLRKRKLKLFLVKIDPQFRRYRPRYLKILKSLAKAK